MTKRRPYAARVPIEERREQLLDAAIRLVVREGYDGVSVEAIAREAGVTRPVVYGAFDGLGALLGALLDRQQARALAQLATAFPADVADPVEALLAGARTMAERVRDDPLTWAPILAAPQGTPDVVRRRIDADRDRVREHLAGLLVGVLPEDVDVELAAHALVASLEHFGRLLVEEPGRFEVDRLVGFAEGIVRLGPAATARSRAGV